MENNNNENTEQYTPLEDSVATTEVATINEPETTESANYSSYSPELPSEEVVSEDAATSSSEEIDLGNYSTPMDFSYLDTPKIAEDDKKHEEEQRISTELNNPFHKETKSEFMENEAIPFATAQELETGWRDESKPGNSKEELEEAQKKLDKDIFSPEQKRSIANFDPNKGSTITDIAHILTFGLAPTFNKIKDFDKVAYSSFVERKAKETGDADKAIRDVNKLIEGSQLGLAKEGIEYWRETGQTLGNKYAVEAENAVTSALEAYNDGKLGDKELEEILDAAVTPSNSTQLGSLLSSPALKGLEIYGLGAAAGAAIGKGLSIAAEKITPKIVDKLVETAMSNSKAANAAEKVLKMLSSNPAVRAELSNAKKFDIFEKAMKNDFSGDFYKSGIGKYLADNYGETLASQINNAAKIASGGDDILRVKDVKVITDAIKKGIITGEDVVKAIASANNVSEDTAKKAAVASGITIGATEAAKALPTGIPDESGKQINSRDIVSDRQKNPYNGDDAVTLRTNEGTVTVSPREAVIIGEAEHLTPEMGYTEDVIKSAEGSEIIPTEKDNDYGFDFSDAEMKAGYYDKDGKYIGEYPERSFLTKVGDVVQAILGGKDINNDKTISAREWYDSTLGKLFKGTANVISSLSPKNIKNTVDKLGQKLSDSLPGVYDMKTGDVYINQDYKGSLPTSPGEAKVKIRNVLDEMLPSYSDSTAQSAKKELIGDVIGLPIYNLPGHVASKLIGNYITSVADEIGWLESGKRMEPGQKYATNLVITNGVMSAFDPLSSVANLLSEAKGLETGAKIESKFNGQLLLPYDEVYINFSSDQENKPYTASSGYGTSDESLKANGKYSGYREQAKDSNLATDYNAGMEKETNEAVSDKYVKIFKTILNHEPDYTRKVLMGIKNNG